jgi:hypothetical protein
MSSEKTPNAAPVDGIVLQPVDEVLDAIYTFCDVLMHEQNIAVLDSVCGSWPIDDAIETNLDQVLGVLTATLPIKSRLPSRDVLLKRARLVYGNDSGLFDGL